MESVLRGPRGNNLNRKGVSRKLRDGNDAGCSKCDSSQKRAPSQTLEETRVSRYRQRFWQATVYCHSVDQSLPDNTREC